MRVGRRDGHGGSVKPMRAATAAVLLSVATSGLAPLPAHAAGDPVVNVQSSYWWSAETASSKVPAPPIVPAGGLWVSSAPSGDQAISALSFTLPLGQAAPTITLSVNQAAPASQVAIVACAPMAPWKAVTGPGVWADRPTADCAAGEVAGVLNTADTTVTFDLTSLVAAGAVDVVIIPAPSTGPTSAPTPVAPPVPVAPSFNITFQPFTASQVATSSSAQPAAPAAPAPTPTPAPAPVVAPLPSFADQTQTSLPPDQAGLFPSFSLPPVPQAPVVATPIAPGAAAATPAASALGSPAANLTTGDNARSWWARLLLAAMMLGLVAYALWQRNKVSSSGRPALSLYDVPPSEFTGSAPGIPGSERGLPPALR
ncbi:MAG TPA: hypothetical protein VND70_08885 [Acidimicrobiales bacterium]|nr:hypothetical protein [Acidimicrobiales bacterium]